LGKPENEDLFFSERSHYSYERKGENISDDLFLENTLILWEKRGKF